jgi:hypothetical protein
VRKNTQECSKLFCDQNSVRHGPSPLRYRIQIIERSVAGEDGCAKACRMMLAWGAVMLIQRIRRGLAMPEGDAALSPSEARANATD